MKIHRVRSAFSHHHGIFYRCSQRNRHLRQPPSHWDRGTSQHRESHGVRRPYHLARLLKAVGKMLVVINRHNPLASLEHRHALLKKFITRIQLLPFIVRSVLAVLPHNQHRIAGQGLPAATQRFGNRRIHAEAKLLRARLAQIAFRLLIHIERNHLHIRLMPLSINRIPNQKPIANVLPMRKIFVDGRDNCHPHRRPPRRHRLERNRRSRGRT